MPMQWQDIEIPLVGGLDTRTDRKLIAQTDMYGLTNAVFAKDGVIQKRNGYTKFSTSKLAGGTISAGHSLARHNDQLLVFDGTTGYTWNEQNDKWISVGSIYSADVETFAYGARTFSTIPTGYATCASANNITVYVYSFFNLTLGIIEVNADVIDNATGATILSNQALGGMAFPVNAHGPRAIALGDYILVLNHDQNTGNIIAKKLDTTNPTEFTTAWSHNGLAAPGEFDVCKLSDGTTGILAYMTNAPGNQINLVDFSHSAIGALSASHSTTVNAGMCVCVDGSDNVYVFWGEASSDVYVIGFTSSLASLFSVQTVESGLSSDIGTVVAVQASSTTVRCFYSLDVSNVTQIRSATVNSSGTVSGAAIFLRGVSILSKPFYSSSLSIVFINVGHVSSLQGTAFTVDASGNILARYWPGWVRSSFDSDVAEVSSGKFVSTFLKYQGLDSYQVEWASIAIDFASSKRILSAGAGENTFLAGSQVYEYDGKRIVEHGFHIWPETLTAGTNRATGGLMGNGTYNYKAVYRWTDNNGQIHRSAPSLAKEITTAAGGTSQEQDVIVPSLRLSAKSNVLIELYRTTNGGSTYYLSRTTENDSSADTTTVTDETSDSDLTDNTALYTDSGEVENIPPASPDFIHGKSERIFALVGGYTLTHTKKTTEAMGVMFSDIFDIELPRSGGKATALATIDDSLAIFKRTSIYLLSGDGPNDLAQGDFAGPSRIMSPVGCSDPRSIVQIPLGLIFKSLKGFYLLGRDLSLQYIGAPVQLYNSHTVTSATLVENTNEVRFCLNSAGTRRVLLYDYVVNKWSVFSGPMPLEGSNYNDKFAYVETDGEVWTENTGYRDDSTTYALSVYPGWIKLSGLAGYQRVRRFAILGEKKSLHTLIVRVYYDYNNTASETFTLSSASISTGTRYLFRRRLARQKCAAIRFEIEDSSPGADTYEGYNISAIALEVGTLGGITRGHS